MTFLPLWATDVTLALLAPVAWLLALRGGRTALRVAAALTVARLAPVGALALLLGPRFADHALLVGLPVALLSAAPALAVGLGAAGPDPSRALRTGTLLAGTTGSLAAAGVALLQPYRPDLLLTAGLLAAAATVGALGAAAAAGARPASPALLVPGVLLAGVAVVVGSGAAVALSASRPQAETAIAATATGAASDLAHAGHTGHAGHAGHAAQTGGAAEGSAPGAATDAGRAGTPVATFSGPRDGEPAQRLVLTAGMRRLELPGGGTVDALAFDGGVPGPELRLREGELVEVELRNADVPAGVTLHWHGIDVPAAEDGVPGLTQASVPVGGSHTYRFVPDRAGTFWYHSHTDSADQVGRGLYGVVVVEPRDGVAEDVDIPLPVRSWEDVGLEATTVGASDALERRPVAPGSSVRVRLVGTSGASSVVTVAGSPFRVAATDGSDVVGGAELPPGTRLPLAGGARTDVVLTMPDEPVLVAPPGIAAGLLLVPQGAPDAAAPEVPDGPTFDRLSYGTPQDTPFDASTPADVEAEKVIDARLIASGGAPSFGFTINGGNGPTAPTLVVQEGDLVRVRIVNRSFAEHPMHLHGHRVLVLSRDGEPVTGSPWWTDTVPVAPGETYEIAYRADNPGVWMDHCHDLLHAENGMVGALVYAGVTP